MANVRLEAIAENEFEEFMEATLPSYSRARARADHTSLEAAEKAARRQQAEILPAGFSTPGHHFFRIWTPQAASVGTLWLGLHSETRAAYVYDIVVFEPHRRRGYASSARHSAEELARKAGCDRIGLNVFEPNSSAQALYHHLGYSVGSLYMNKPL